MILLTRIMIGWRMPTTKSRRASAGRATTRRLPNTRSGLGLRGNATSARGRVPLEGSESPGSQRGRATQERLDPLPRLQAPKRNGSQPRLLADRQVLLGSGERPAHLEWDAERPGVDGVAQVRQLRARRRKEGGCWRVKGVGITCEVCKGKTKKKVRRYTLFNTILKVKVATLWLCDACVFPLLYTQAKEA